MTRRHPWLQLTTVDLWAHGYTLSQSALLTRFPVAAKIALHTAGAIGGVPGPRRACASLDGTMYTSIFGISARRTIW